MVGARITPRDLRRCRTAKRDRWPPGHFLLKESEARLRDFDLTRFLQANRFRFARKRS
jgi:hypothetical protein